MVRKKRRNYWIERDYKSFMRRKQGRKLIGIFRILAKSISTIKEIQVELGYSRSEIYKLLSLAEEHEYVYKYSVTRRSGPPGKPKTGRLEKDTGRPPLYHSLTSKGLFLMRFDPELADKWMSVEEKYAGIEKPTVWDSYINLAYAIQKHPDLSTFERPYYFDEELQRTLLNPLLFEDWIDDKQFNILSDELVRLISKNVRPEHIEGYYSSLQRSVFRLGKIIRRHKLLIKKIKSLQREVLGNHLN